MWQTLLCLPIQGRLLVATEDESIAATIISFKSGLLIGLFPKYFRCVPLSQPGEQRLYLPFKFASSNE